MMRCGSCWRLTAVAMISSKAAFMPKSLSSLMRSKGQRTPFIIEIVYDSMAVVGFAGVDADEEVLMRRDRERRRRGRQSRQNARRRRANKIASKAKKRLKANGK
jgi:spore germination protein YaaH